jgi:ornithine cyclodeaminase
MRVLSDRDTRLALPMSDAIAAMLNAFSPNTEAPLRQLVANSLVMPGRIGDNVAVKVVSTVPGNPAGLVAVFNSEGTPLGIVDGPTITAIRTAAGAGLATDLLAPEDASSLAMIGAGAMARDQILAMLEIRDIDRVVVWSRDPSKARALASEFEGETAATAAGAVHGVDIITTATPSTAPLFAEPDLPGHVHINAIGSYTPDMVEIPPEFVIDAFVVVDDLSGAASEAGDLIQAGCTPDLDMESLLTLSSVPHHSRTLFKSVGVATMDVAAAVAALRNAERLQLGHVLPSGGLDPR